MKTTITGATGYIGSRLVNRLLSDGCIVSAVVQPGDLRSLPPEVIRLEDTGTSRGNAETLRTLKPDVVIHLAACQELTDNPEAVDALVESNVAFGARVLASAAAPGALGLISAGTFMVHADGTPSYAPQTLYAATKQAFTDLAAQYHRWGALRVTVLELSDTYGPEDSRPKFLNLLYESSRSGSPLDATPGQQLVYPIHVDDVVDAFAHAAHQVAQGVELDFAYSLCGSRGVSIRELVDIFSAATGLSPEVRFGGRSYRRNEIMTPYVGERLPGWTPSIPLHEGLRTTFNTHSAE